MNPFKNWNDNDVHLKWHLTITKKLEWCVIIIGQVQKGYFQQIKALHNIERPILKK